MNESREEKIEKLVGLIPADRKWVLAEIERAIQEERQRLHRALLELTLPRSCGGEGLEIDRGTLERVFEA